MTFVDHGNTGVFRFANYKLVATQNNGSPQPSTGDVTGAIGVLLRTCSTDRPGSVASAALPCHRTGGEHCSAGLFHRLPRLDGVVAQHCRRVMAAVLRWGVDEGAHRTTGYAPMVCRV